MGKLYLYFYIDPAPHRPAMRAASIMISKVTDEGYLTQLICL